MRYFAVCICHDCYFMFNTEYEKDCDVECPECESENIEFTRVEELE